MKKDLTGRPLPSAPLLHFVEKRPGDEVSAGQPGRMALSPDGLLYLASSLPIMRINHRIITNQRLKTLGNMNWHCLYSGTLSLGKGERHG
jgi:hypothetical protein